MPLVPHGSNGDCSPNLRGSQLQSVSVLVDASPGRPQVIGRAAPVVYYTKIYKYLTEAIEYIVVVSAMSFFGCIAIVCIVQCI